MSPSREHLPFPIESRHDPLARVWMDSQLAELAAMPTTHGRTNPRDEIKAVHPRLARLVEIAEVRLATDLHIASGQVPHIRVGGRVEPLVGISPLDRTIVESMLNSVQGEEQRRDFNRSGQAQLMVEPGSGSRVRIRVTALEHGPAATLRLLPAAIPSPQELGLPPAVSSLAREARGLLLVAGPMGSGRTTTMAALVDSAVSRRGAHVVTLDELSEYWFPDRRALITRLRIHPDQRSVADGLTESLAHNADVVVASDLGEPAAFAAALKGCEHGQLVIGGLGGTNTSGVLASLVASVDKGGRELTASRLANVLLGVLAQRLVPRRDGGVVLATELLTADGQVRAELRAGRFKQLATRVETSRSPDMYPLERSLAALVRNGTVTTNAARAFSDDPVALMARLQEPHRAASTAK